MLLSEPDTQSGLFFSAQFPKAVATTANDESAAATAFVKTQVARDAWERVIDTLIDWARDPSVIEDEGIDPATRETIGDALQLAYVLQKGHAHPPTRVVPSPNAEIVFELEIGDIFESITVSEPGSREYRLFEGSRLIRHE